MKPYLFLLPSAFICFAPMSRADDQCSIASAKKNADAAAIALNKIDFGFDGTPVDALSSSSQDATNFKFTIAVGIAGQPGASMFKVEVDKANCFVSSLTMEPSLE